MKDLDKLTMATESRAAIAKISAHDTTGPLQAWLTAALISSTTSKPLIELILGNAVFSPRKKGVSSSRTDPSHPCSLQTIRKFHVRAYTVFRLSYFLDNTTNYIQKFSEIILFL